MPGSAAMWWIIASEGRARDPDVDPEEDVTITVSLHWHQGLQQRRVDEAEVSSEEEGHRGRSGRRREQREDTLDGGDQGGRPGQGIVVPLVEGPSSRANVTRATGDGAYNSEEIFRYLDRKGIQLRVRQGRGRTPLYSPNAWVGAQEDSLRGEGSRD